MAYTTIDKPSDYFNTVLYSGNSGTQSITGVGFQPDWTWVKRRNGVTSHGLTDSVRGAGLTLFSDTTQVEQNYSAYFTSFDSDGFSLAIGGNVYNASGSNYVAWNWLGGGTAVSNTNGDITSSVSANTTAGFSIVSFTGTGSNATVGHGLSQAPSIYIVKNRASATDWRVAQTITPTNTMTDGNGYYMELNSTKASTNPGSASQWGSPPTAPTSTVVSVGNTSPVNGSGNAMIIYCFHSVKGFSKIGSYTGNGTLDNGTFVYCGFKPSWVLIKRTNSTSSWQMNDNKRNSYNSNSVQSLFSDLSNAEASSTGNDIDFVSNGFKLMGNGTGTNASGSTYIYMAFAENPFTTSTGIPCTAR